VKKNMSKCGRPAERLRGRLLGNHFRPTLEQLEGRQLLSTGVLTYHNDLARSGANLAETILTHDNVHSATFGKLFSYSVDGQVYAQPLYVPNVILPDQSVHNLVLVATEHDSVYAFDANNNDPTQGGGLLWHDSFIDPTNGITTVPAAETMSDNIAPEIGITGTPVIDGANGLLYVVSKTKEVRSDGPHYVQTLHALDIRTGKEMNGGPALIADTLNLGRGKYQFLAGASVPGTGDGSVDGVVTFNGLRANQRSGLVLANGVVYVAWASHGDNGPYQGWVIGYDAHTLNQVSAFNAAPNGARGGIWMSGGAPAVDGSGNLYLATGNGTFDVTGTLSPAYGDSILKLAPGDISVTDYFTPWNQADLDAIDFDLGSGGVLLLPDSVGNALHPHLMVQAGKEGKIYVIDRNDLGQYQRAGSGNDDVVQVIPNAIQGRGAYDTPTYFDAGTPNNRWIYLVGWRDSVRAFRLSDDGMLSSSATSQSSNVFSAPHGATPSLSANGTADAIVWVISADSPNAVLYAYDATDLANELYDSNQAGTRDQLDGGVVFSVPTIADGEVFVGTADTLSVFGLLPAGKAAPPKKGSFGPFMGPGIVQLLGPLTCQESLGVAGNAPSVGAGRANLLPSQAVLALLIGSADQLAKEVVFAESNSARQGTESTGQLSVDDFEMLRLDLVYTNPASA
jgi:hypothetical protein